MHPAAASLCVRFRETIALATFSVRGGGATVRASVAASAPPARRDRGPASGCGGPAGAHLTVAAALSLLTLKSRFGVGGGGGARQRAQGVLRRARASSGFPVHPSTPAPRAPADRTVGFLVSSPFQRGAARRGGAG
eukprot:tig00020553_g10515.t1